MNIRFALLAALILAIAPAAPSFAAENSGSRVALVIGNAKYPDSEAPLKEPLNDVRDVADELKHDGFDVETGQRLAPRIAQAVVFQKLGLQGLAVGAQRSSLSSRPVQRPCGVSRAIR